MKLIVTYKTGVFGAPNPVGGVAWLDGVEGHPRQPNLGDGNGVRTSRILSVTRSADTDEIVEFETLNTVYRKRAQ